MIDTELLATIRNHRGPIYVGMLLRDDVVYVKVVKEDLLSRLRCIQLNQAYASITEGCMYIHNAS